MATGYKDFNLLSPTSSSTITGVLRVEYSYTQNISANTSTVIVTSIKYMSKSHYSTWFYANGRIKVGPLNIDFANSGSADGCYVQAQNTWYELGTGKTGGSFTVNHGSNGTGSFNIQITYNPASYRDGDTVNFWIYCDADWHGNGKNSGSQTAILDTIIRQFTLSISAGVGSTVSVTRDGVVLSDGATITYDDVLTIAFGVSTGYDLNTHTVNGSVFTSGDTHTVTAAVSIISSATVKSFVLSISADTHTTVTVNRTSSPKQGAAQGYLTDGSTVYHGDVLSVSYRTSTGYAILTHTLNGNTFASGSSHTVTTAVTIVTTAIVKTFTLTRTVGIGSSLIVRRISSPNGGGNIGIITSNTVYYGDVLELMAAATPGYSIDQMLINNTLYTDNPHTHTVTAATTITIISKALGFVYIDSGSAIEKYKIVIDSGSILEQYRVMVDTGSEIIPY